MDHSVHCVILNHETRSTISQQFKLNLLTNIFNQQQPTSMSYPDLRIVFDFFTDNPQKLVKQKGPQRQTPTTPLQQSPGYENESGGCLPVVADPYWSSIRKMQVDTNFMEAQYPYLHYIVYNQPTNDVSVRLTDRRNDSMISRPARSPLQLASLERANKARGVYQEMCTYVTPHTPLLPKRPSNPNTAFSVSAFKTVGNLNSLDQNWTYWSGADYIVENIPKRLKLERVTFHKIRLGSSSSSSSLTGGGSSYSYSDTMSLLGSPVSSQHHQHYHNYNYHCSNNENFNDDDSFSYVLLCEIGDALVDMNRTREFIDTLKYRQCGVTSMCVIDHFF
ncbi:hypothetical protein HELRODRAFT_174935 [Helobdella robusta]|uniref:DUF7153 domain-containing protein n=1 Tax=Helobdella robusta TaxID=6412 RepID=T1F8M7_HELRO|nr:hypothetical protein HELRODRAFT_174935 [Helobdella robusta]ESO01380.1 hypothetical protein HELRODRAFT_174935 [Helobdella robusta]